MRITGGMWRGRKLAAPLLYGTRPTSDRARQALFNILVHAAFAPDLEGAIVLDAFCGTGALGLEALSRGAAMLYQFDTGKAALDAAKINARNLGALENIRQYRVDARTPPAAPASCDLVFLDPPYCKGLLAPALSALREAGWFTDDALIVIETADKTPEQIPAGFTILDNRTYGATRLIFLKARDG
ncbi:MAG: 16S rRNA (guanine(966)-N(2))-methyltransferase RsmD [Pseudomonadota bacterium]|nr:16S rRNA (guanine(966)-N(2))-methyltransferase RsmD [Pseudomonadota bacterium]